MRFPCGYRHVFDAYREDGWSCERATMALFFPRAHRRLSIVLNSFTVFSIGVDLTQTTPIEIGS